MVEGTGLEPVPPLSELRLFSKQVPSPLGQPSLVEDEGVAPSCLSMARHSRPLPAPGAIFHWWKAKESNPQPFGWPGVQTQFPTRGPLSISGTRGQARTGCGSLMRGMRLPRRLSGVELRAGLEPAVSPLPRACPAVWAFGAWRSRRDSNPRWRGCGPLPSLLATRSNLGEGTTSALLPHVPSLS